MDLQKLSLWKKILIGFLLAVVAVAGYFVYADLSKMVPVSKGWGFILILFFFPFYGFLYAIFGQNRRAKTLLITLLIAGTITIALGPTVLQLDVSRVGDIAEILILVSIIAIVLYKFVYPALYPLTEEELADSKKREITISLPYNQAYQLCLRSLQTFDFIELESSDPAAGSVLTKVMGVRIRFTIRKISGSETEVIVAGSLTDPQYTRYIEWRTRDMIRMLDELIMFLANHQTLESGYPYGEDTNPEAPLKAAECVSKNLMGAVLLSLFIPGLGQSYNGKWNRGILILIATAAGLIVFILPGVVIWVYGIYETYATSRKINESSISCTPVNGWVVLVHFLAGLALVVFSVMLFVILYWRVTGVHMISAALGGPGY